MRCAVLDDYQDAAAGLADWSRVDLTVFREHLDTEDEVAEALAEFDVVVIMRERTPFPASLIARLPRLKLLITSGMRNASIDLKAAAAKGITVCGTASSSTPPVELTWALILGLCRHVVPENAAFRTAGAWQSTIGTDLAGATLGLLGLGKIGTRVAAIAKAFGMEVLAWSQNLTVERAEAVGAVLASSKEELLAGSDIVSIHLALSDRTRGLVDAAALAAMKPSALLVNTSRAAIVDTEAMIAALSAGRLAGAGLDVFDLEPLPLDHPLRTLPTVLATPHLGYVTRGNYFRYFTEAVEDIDAFAAGEPVRVLG
ncbi:D-2-hydroxyacid dehydrogenase family protein [Kutzneria chonburiensis]|uniref:D-2-hydroxyacid dehydrogenase family protein n=1 Tax=Kutzneria chonburiensis TaxID=1483604 RepID=A0ABV6MUM0_9PSEU|nr:D-2-hydroxyacid dehydrogenase family protein [Kutzneria chonburiensis]